MKNETPGRGHPAQGRKVQIEFVIGKSNSSKKFCPFPKNHGVASIFATVRLRDCFEAQVKYCWLTISEQLKAQGLLGGAA